MHTGFKRVIVFTQLDIVNCESVKSCGVPLAVLSNLLDGMVFMQVYHVCHFQHHELHIVLFQVMMWSLHLRSFQN